MIYWELFITFFQIGLFTIGGGYAMIPLIQQKVTTYGWLSASEVVDFIAISESTPGPFAVNISTFIGMKMGGLPGAIVSSLGVILPSFIIILIIARFFANFKDNKYVEGAMRGLRPAAMGLLTGALVLIAYRCFFPSGFVTTGWQAFVFSIDWISIGIFLVVYLCYTKWKLHPIVVVLGSAAMGIVAYQLVPMLIAT